MNTKEFAQEAIKNGHGSGTLCEGWDWIRANLHELDSIFQTAKYKEQNGMKYKCMPFLKSNAELSIDEESALATAWYLNNERKHRAGKEEYKQKMLSEGWEPLTEEIVKIASENKQKILVSATHRSDWLTTDVSNTYKPFIFNRDGKEMYGLMKLKARSRGYSLHQFDNAFCKLI